MFNKLLKEFKEPVSVTGALNQFDETMLYAGTQYVSPVFVPSNGAKAPEGVISSVMNRKCSPRRMSVNLFFWRNSSTTGENGNGL